MCVHNKPFLERLWHYYLYHFNYTFILITLKFYYLSVCVMARSNTEVGEQCLGGQFAPPHPLFPHLSAASFTCPVTLLVIAVLCHI